MICICPSDGFYVLLSGEDTAGCGRSEAAPCRTLKHVLSHEIRDNSVNLKITTDNDLIIDQQDAVSAKVFI